MTPGAALRVIAAQALLRIVHGESLRRVLSECAPKVEDSRDRALLSALLFASTRWWLRFDALLGELLEKPLPAQAQAVRAVLVLGFVQHAILQLPDYAVVAATVDAVRLLGHSRHAGLVNAVLRRFLRERVALEANLDSTAVTRYAHPAWLIKAIQRDWPQCAEIILLENNREAALTLRVNRCRVGVDTLRNHFLAANIMCEPHPQLADALILAESTDVTRLPGYAEGLFSVQDGSAQRVLSLLDVHDGQRVLDACAAPGGKAAHILETADVELVALEREESRLRRTQQNLSRLGLTAEMCIGDAAQPETWWDKRVFDRILLDVPCSATGIIRRQPDIKLHRRATDILALASTQLRLLSKLWPLLAPGGRLVYATCSLLKLENEDVIKEFLDKTSSVLCLPVPQEYGLEAAIGRQHLPGAEGMDGFYYAILEKVA